MKNKLISNILHYTIPITRIIPRIIYGENENTIWQQLIVRIRLHGKQQLLQQYILVMWYSIHK